MTRKKSYREYNSNRTIINDYLYRWSILTDDDLKDTELDLEDCYTFFRWFSEDSEVFTTEKLGMVKEKSGLSIDLKLLIWNTRQYFKEKYSFLAWAKQDVCILLLTFLAAAYPIKSYKRNILALLVFGICTLGMYAFMIWLGRIEERVTFSVLISMAVFTMLLPTEDTAYGGNCQTGTKKTDYNRRFDFPYIVRVFAPAAVVLILVIYCVTSNGTQITPFSENRDKNASLDLINRKENEVFLFAPDGLGVSDGKVWWCTYNNDYCDNLFYLGGWDARCPYNVNRLKQYGIDNPAKALFEDDRVYSMKTPMTEIIVTHLRKHYGETIDYNYVESINGLEIIQFVRKE